MRTAAILAATILAASPAYAQAPACGAYDQIVKQIGAPKYGERKVARGETKIGAEGGKIALEVFASPKGKTFTIILIRPDGLACIIAAGDNLKTFPLPVEGVDI